MEPDACVRCNGFPCPDVDHSRYLVPHVDVHPETISIVMIAEAAPADPSEYFYAGPEALFGQTTLQAFRDAGIPVSSVPDLLERGVYLTTAVKCGKRGYGLASGTVKECSRLLEQELALFPHAQVLLLMGDVAIKALNAIAQRHGRPRPVPAGATYKIRGGEFVFGPWRAFPSYLQAGPAFFMEKSKRQMIAQDIAAAMALAGR